MEVSDMERIPRGIYTRELREEEVNLDLFNQAAPA